MLRRFSVSRSLWLDALFLAALVLLFNFIFARNDPGWMKLNPSPFYLIPIVIGAWHGFASGLYAGLITIIAVVMAHYWKGAASPADLITANGWFFASFPIIGGTVGELLDAYRKNQAQTQRTNETMAEKLSQLDAEMRLQRQNTLELERMLATRDSEVATLDVELRRLADSEGPTLYSNLLLLLNRACRVSDAALYEVEGDQLIRKGLLGNAAHLPERAKPEDMEIVQVALKHRTVVSIPDFWEQKQSTDKRYLLAVPLLQPNGQAPTMLVVSGMPFLALNQKTVKLILLICQWGARLLEMQSAPKEVYRPVEGMPKARIYTAEQFRENAELAWKSCRQHNLTSSAVLFCCPDGPAEAQKELEKTVVPSVRNGDYATTVPSKFPNVAVLLPLTGERGANIFSQRVAKALERNPVLRDQTEFKIVTMQEGQTFDAWWKEITTP